MIKLITALVIAMLLAACAGCAETKYVIRTQLVAPGDALLLDCETEAPPSRDDYAKGTPKEREKMLFDHAQAQMLHQADCNKRMKALRDWKIEQKNVYKDTVTTTTKPEDL